MYEKPDGSPLLVLGYLNCPIGGRRKRNPVLSLERLTRSSFELHAVTVTLPIKLYIAVIYRLPGPLRNFFDEMDAFLTSPHSLFKTMVLAYKAVKVSQTPCPSSSAPRYLSWPAGTAIAKSKQRSHSKSMITNYNYNKEAHIVTHMYAKGERGRPKIMLSQQYASRLLEIGLSVPCIGKPLAVSVKTLFRRMGKWGLSVRELYSTLGDDKLDSLLSEMHTVNPNAGYRMVMAILGAKGHRVQWDRVMYLGTAKNNWASTTLAFFNEAGERYGFPQRSIRDSLRGGDQVSEGLPRPGLRLVGSPSSTGTGLLALWPTLAHAAGVPTDWVGQVVQVTAALTSAPDREGWFARVVRPGPLLEASWVEIKCVHGDVHRYPVVTIEIRFHGEK
ncbi:hypothetical protein N1851_025474 [Merluccius polli]|uniref:Uncharacterized protein n=1 Tax=Merluccius polli TaxID=89951 RepID=A0AA47MDS1_MERPO|nr:hypothetical protein N1851_025474 [Merluccius polli]